MGRRGPPPKPRALRVLDGDRLDRINDAQPVPRSVLPEMPSWLADDLLAVTEWDHSIAEATFMRVLTAADGRVLALYCQAMANSIRASRAVAKLGPVVKGYKGAYVKNPAVAIQRDAASFAARLALQFGFTPASRTAIHAEPPEEQDRRESLLS